jgi:glycosyltransferase involved in cell wall biosynthesis
VLAAPTAGVPEAVTDTEHGFLIGADDACGYADRIQRLLADSGLHRHVTEQAYIRVKRENCWAAYCQRISELYAELNQF